MPNPVETALEAVITENAMAVEAYEALNTLQLISEQDEFTGDRYRQFYKFFPRNRQRILDLGCNIGRGGWVLKHIDPSLRISGLDCVKDRLTRIPEELYEEKIYGLSTEIPVANDTFDVVVAGEVLEHLYPEDIDKTLGEIFRILKVGGRLLLTTPNPKDIKRKIKKQSVLGGCHVSQHFDDVLKWRMKLIGYSKVRIIGTGKVSRYLGYRFPWLSIYGSYMAMGDKY
ncbi:MAG: class I SAM-dependent methyltransferase [Rhodothermaceae bacterium]|nr:class I SAM-dependent methyltransferase [Rhodothermaceae bacterium]